MHYARLIVNGTNSRYVLSDDDCNRIIDLTQNDNVNYPWITDLNVFGHFYDMQNDYNQSIDIPDWMRRIDFAVTTLLRQQRNAQAAQ